MDVYLMTNGQNQQREEILRLLNLDETSIIRFRDCGIDKVKSIIWILARTGSANAFGKNNEHLKNADNFIGKKDDSFDSTYELIFFMIPIYKRIDYIKHQPTPNLKNVVTRFVSNLQKGIVNPNAKKFMEDFKKTMEEIEHKDQRILSFIDRN